MQTRLALLISENDSNLQAILDAIRLRVLEAEVAVVVSDQQKVLGLERATKAGIPTALHLLPPTTAGGRTHSEYDADLAAMLKGYQPDFVVLAGWRESLSDAFLRHFPYRVVKSRPALPGKFLGPNTVANALAAFERGEIKKSGATVFLLSDRVSSKQVDAALLLGTQEVPIYAHDSEESLARRIQQAEQLLLVKALDRLICGDVG